MHNDWGTERIRRRTARRRRRIVWAIVGLALASLLVPFAMGVVDGFRNAHAGTDSATLRPYIGFGVALAMALLVPVLAWRAMRDADEVERERSLSALAGAGVTALVLLPVLTAGQSLFGIESPAMIAWGAALGTAIGLFVLRRWRG